MQVFRTPQGVIAEHDGRVAPLATEWDALFSSDDPIALVAHAFERSAADPGLSLATVQRDCLAPVGTQEVWAAGVTYFRSRDARMEESRDAAGGDLYARVYDAERPELFFKSTPHRVVGHGGLVRLRADSKWNVPEPELTLAINRQGRIFGVTIGNDMSSRDIEGENPLYLPQAKMYDGSCALGPGIVLAAQLPTAETAIHLSIMRQGKAVFTGATTLAQLKRQPQELVGYLFRHNSFPNGVFLMTGTGIVPPNDFTLASGDLIQIEVSNLGQLCNTVA